MNLRHLLSFSLLIALCGVSSLQAQFARVEFDYGNAYFNNGQPLPAEQRMVITGDVAETIQLVEMDIFRAKSRQDRPALFSGLWKRHGEVGPTDFRIPVNFKLTGNTDYDIRITYYRDMPDREKAALRRDMYQILDNYLAQSIEPTGRRVRLLRSPSNIVQDLNAIVEEGMLYYRNLNVIEFRGFSNLVEQALDNLDGLKEDAREEGIKRIQLIVHTEVDQILNADLVVREDVRQVPQYETERTRRPLSINVGFGGVLLDRDSENLSYDTSPYVGISLPLANPRLSGRFWGNTSISLGVFTSNFENGDGNVVTGPIFGRPYYLGLGYNFFRFIRLNVGATAIEALGTSSINNGNAAIDVDAISIRPFIGISAELDLWLGLRERR